MDGNEGSLGGIGDLAGVLASQRMGGTFATQTAMLAFPAKGRKTGMLVCVLEDCSQYVYDADGVDGLQPDDELGRWRPVRNMAQLYGRSFSLAVAVGLLDVDAFVDGVATKATADTLNGAELNGVAVNGTTHIGAHPTTGIAFWPCVFTASQTAGYTAGSVITFTGTYGGAAVTRTVALTQANGNETLIANGPMETVSQIDIEAQPGTSGAFDFGYSGIGPVLLPGGTAYKKWLVKSFADAANADTAAVHVGYPDGTTDTVELAKGAALEAAPSRIYGDTTAPITVYE